MRVRNMINLMAAFAMFAITASAEDAPRLLGKFDLAKDLFIAQFDGRPDADDVHAQAAVGSMLQHPEFANVSVYGVHNAYGRQTGVIHDSRSLMAMIFGGPEGPDTWTDANTPTLSERSNPASKWAISVNRIADKVQSVLNTGGAVWVMEAGQSDITSYWVAELITRGVSESVIKQKVTVVQHSTWNENNASSGILDYVKLKTTYVKIEDGNHKNTTPDYETDDDELSAHGVLRTDAKTSANPNATTRALWTEADRIIGSWSASYSCIGQGGLDFSDAVLAWWIFEPANAFTIPDFWSKYVMSVATPDELATYKVLYLYGNVKDDGTIPAPVGQEFHQMRLTDTGIRGLSGFKTAIEDEQAAIMQAANVKFEMVEAYDAGTLLTRAFLDSYKVIIIGSTQKVFSNAERTAVGEWVNAGGGLIAWSDSAFGGAWNIVGVGNPVGRNSNNSLTTQFGMYFMRDNGAGNYAIKQWETNHYLNDMNRNEGVVFRGEGVSVVRVSLPSVLLAKLQDGGLGGAIRLHADDGAINMNTDAAVAVAEVGQGRVIGTFDRNTFWNAGEGTRLSHVDNREYAQRLVIWAAGKGEGTTPVNQAPSVDAGQDVSITLPTNSVNLSGAATDDGLPNGTLVTVWSKVSGPGTVSFADASALVTTATFSAAGTYVLRLTADDGEKSASDDVTITVEIRNTVISIVGEEFHINGRPTYEGRTWQGHRIEGLLMNARLVQGIFDDLNPETVSLWNYPDGPWDADRNTSEFVAAMPAWRQHGLLCAVVNLQGGSPEGYSQSQPWHNSAIRDDGSLHPEYMARLERIIDRADDLGMVIMVGIFYFGQDQRLVNEEAVKQAVINTVDWIADKGYSNVLLEIANEHNLQHYVHSIIRYRPQELIVLAKQRAVQRGINLPVSVSLGGGGIPSQAVVDASDYILLHGNGVTNPSTMVNMVNTVRSMAGSNPKPIVNNEDDRPWRGQGWGTEGTSNNFIACVRNYASWGYFDFRQSGESFDQGFQSMPTNWQISSDRKRSFFNLVAEITGGESVPIPDPDLGMADGPDTRSDSAGYVSAIRFTAQASFSADTMHGRFASDSGSGNIRMAIYADDGAKPGQLLGETAQFNFGPGLHSAALLAPLDVVEGAVYWLTSWHNSGTGKPVAHNGVGARFRVTKAYSQTDAFPQGSEFAYSADTTYAYFATGSAVVEPTFSLTVNSGTGGGSYTAGTVVTITANAAPAGQQFDTWTGDTAGVANVTAASTTLTMPAAATTVTATYSITPVVQGPYGGSPWLIPGTIQAENYDLGGAGIAYHDTTLGNSGNSYRNDDVDIQATSDVGSGYNVGWIAAGEWLAFTVDVPVAGTYDVGIRVASLSAGGMLRIMFDGVDKTGTIQFHATGGWQTWTTVSVKGVSLNAGEQVMRIAMDSGGWNLNHVTFTSVVNVEHTITASASGGATISPSGSVVVEDGASSTFSIGASSGYEIADIKIDGFSIGVLHSYTFSNVTADHTIEVFSRAVNPEPSSTVAAINCGGGAYTATDGTVYSADQYFSGGKTYSITRAIANTEDDTLYKTERYGNVTYEIPVPDGDYIVTLKFAEIYQTATGKRRFDVSLEGSQVVANLDLFAVAGSDTAYDLTFAATVNDGHLTINIATIVDNAKLSAILVRTQASEVPVIHMPEITEADIQLEPVQISEDIYLTDVNVNGISVGYIAISNVVRGIVIAGDGSILQILDTLGGANSTALAINNGNLIVGTATDAAEVSRAVLWYGDGTIVDLNSMLSPADAAVWHLEYASEITETDTILGGGTFNGQRSVFMMQPR